tara:strand:+ start:492 stop:680 length:189 start_codon:yes stop_codon:yes gene_type:complete
MDFLVNSFAFIRIALILVIGGWLFKACIALIQGKKVEFNFLNPLNLKARWPQQKDSGEKNQD